MKDEGKRLAFYLLLVAFGFLLGWVVRDHQTQTERERSYSEILKNL